MSDTYDPYPTHKVAVEDPLYSTGKNEPKIPVGRRRSTRVPFHHTPFNLVSEVKLEAKRLENWFGAAAVLQNDSQTQFMVFAWSPIDLPNPEGNSVRMIYHTSSDNPRMTLYPILIDGDPQASLTFTKATTCFGMRETAREIWEYLAVAGWKPFPYDAHT
jgi:hypothetical protein